MPESIRNIRLGAVITTNKNQYFLDSWPDSFDEARQELDKFLKEHEDDTQAITQNNAPIGTVATIGHPANQCLVVKTEYGWRYMSGHMDYVDPEEFRGGWDLYDPFKKEN